MGRATHEIAGRVLVMTGNMEAARPVFTEPAQAVAGGGVLAGLLQGGSAWRREPAAPASKRLPRRRERVVACCLFDACAGAIPAWQDGSARQWLAADPATCATLAVDYHVWVYACSKGNPPKHFVARQMPYPPAGVSH